MNLALTRDYAGSDCSQGKLQVADLTVDAIERPWMPISEAPCGRKGVSCVPAGTYRLVRHNSEAHPRAFALVNPDLWVYQWDEDVPEDRRDFSRTVVLIHVANRASELRGCIAPGLSRATINGTRIVSSSRLAMDSIQRRLPWDSDDHTLVIS